MVERLDGVSALVLTLRGIYLEAVTFVCILLVSLEGILPGRWYYWAFLFGGIGFVCLGLGLWFTFRSLKKSKMEVAAGYSTVPKTARENPKLTYLDGRSFAVIAGPDEDRPASGRRRDIDAHLARRQGLGRD